jgi:diaminopimelate decarboxylase
MFVSKNLRVNEKGNLTIGGVDVLYLKEKYGTPIYIMDEDLIRENLKIYKTSLEKYYNGNGMSLYASKAFCNKHICEVVAEEGLGLDVVSGGELYTSLSASFPTENIYFHGNNKTTDELTMAIKNNVGKIVLDNIYELERINKIAKENNKIQKVMFRVKPGIDAHTHDFIMTGQIDSKFGFALETGEAIKIVEEIVKCENVKFEGVHCHIGSQIFDLDPFVEASRVMMNFIREIKDKFGLETNELNLGGGFGIKYTEKDDPIEYEKYIEAVSKEVKTQAENLGLKIPRIIMEPGRSIVAPAGITVYEIGAIKEIPNVRTYVSVDGGMADNPRHIMYGSEYSAVVANKATEDKTNTYTVAGKCCESGDILLRDVVLPKLEVGDTLCVLATGAYNYSMSSNYNRIPRPPVVMVKNGVDKLVVKRETYDDLVKNDL